MLTVGELKSLLRKVRLHSHLFTNLLKMSPQNDANETVILKQHPRKLALECPTPNPFDPYNTLNNPLASTRHQNNKFKIIIIAVCGVNTARFRTNICVGLDLLQTHQSRRDNYDLTRSANTPTLYPSTVICAQQLATTHDFPLNHKFHDACRVRLTILNDKTGRKNPTIINHGAP